MRQHTHDHEPALLLKIANSANQIQRVPKKKLFLLKTLVKDGNEDFIQGTTAMGFCRRGEIGLNSEYKEMCGFIAMEQSKSLWIKKKILKKKDLSPFESA